MEEFELLQQLQAMDRQLRNSLKALRENGTAYAAAEREYKKTLAKECARMRADGTAVTLIDKLCYGLENVADLRFKRDIAEVVYKANIEAINVLKLEIRLLDAQIEREWNNTK